MHKNTAISLALLSILTIGAGCSKDETPTTSATNEPAITQTTPSESLTATDVATKLTTAGLTFTTKDETSDIMALPSKDAATKATKYKIKGTAGNVDITIIELSKPEKAGDVKKDISAQWDVVKKISPTMNMEFVDIGSTNLLATLSYRTDDKALGAQVKSAVEKK